MASTPPKFKAGSNLRASDLNAVSRAIFEVRPGRGINAQIDGGRLFIEAKNTYDILPFFCLALMATERTVKVYDGICYVYGEPYEVEGTDGSTILTLADDTERVWVQFPIEPGSGSSASIQYGTGADLDDVDKNQWGFRVLAHIEIGDTDEISSFSRRWAGGDMYFSD
jgi:hypothetical protein